MLTEWQRFLSTCIEFVLLVTHREPQNLMKILVGILVHIFVEICLHYNEMNYFQLDFWNHFLDILVRIKTSDELDNTNQLNSIWSAKMIRNMSTLCQILTSVPLVIDEPYPNEILDTLLHNFENATTLFSHIRWAVTSEYQNDAENLNVQFMSTVRCFLPLWEKKLLSKNYSIKNILNLAMKLTLEKLYEPKLVHFEAAQLLLTISSTVRLKCVHENEMIKYFLNLTYDYDQISSKIINRSSNKCRHDFVSTEVFNI